MQFSISDFCLAITWIEESYPYAWYSRRGFIHARKLVLLLWLFGGRFIIMEYKSNLRASLIMINYADRFETFHDLVQSGIPLAIPKYTAILDRILSSDPRPTVQRMYKNAITYPYEGGFAPLWINDKLVLTKKS